MPNTLHPIQSGCKPPPKHPSTCPWQVEQQTQAKIERILALDSTKDGYVERRVIQGWHFP